MVLKAFSEFHKFVSEKKWWLRWTSRFTNMLVLSIVKKKNSVVSCACVFNFFLFCLCVDHKKHHSSVPNARDDRSLLQLPHQWETGHLGQSFYLFIFCFSTSQLIQDDQRSKHHILCKQLKANLLCRLINRPLVDFFSFLFIKNGGLTVCCCLYYFHAGSGMHPLPVVF